MNYAVIFAGGTGARMNSRGKPKQFLDVNGKPVIIHTIENFENHPEINGMVIVCIASWIERLKKMLKKYDIEKVKDIVPGGENGQQSICNGLEALNNMVGEDSIVLIHDGVRPLINDTVISENIASVKKYGSAITTSDTKETIVFVDGNETIINVQDRSKCRVAKAPQSFYLKDILRCHRDAKSKGELQYIDSCTLMKEYGYELHSVNGPYENIKITTPDDYYMLKSFLQARDNSQILGL